MRPFIQSPRILLVTAAIAGSLITSTHAAEDEDRIRDAMNESPIAERIFNDHITVLASPWMEGRLPGTKGMEYARDYVAYWFDQAGLEPGWTDPDSGERSWLQPFPMGTTREFTDQVCSVDQRL